MADEFGEDALESNVDFAALQARQRGLSAAQRREFPLGGTGFVSTLNGRSGALVLGGGTSGFTLSTGTGTITMASPLTTKGDIYVRSATAGTRLGVGSNGQVLTADSAEATGVKWATPAAGAATSLNNLASVAINTDLVGAVSGGMGVRGGSAANDDLILEGTTHATRTTSRVEIQPNGGSVIIGASATPNAMLDVRGSIATTGNLGLGIAADATAKLSTGNIRVYEATPPNADASTNRGIIINSTIPSGLITESATTDGEVVSYAVNVPQVGTRDTARVGGILRLDTRAAEQRLVVFGYATGGSTASAKFSISLQSGGVVVGSPTGGDKGAGTLNAVAVYDDNVLLTDWLLDLHYEGKVSPEDKFYQGQPWQRLFSLDTTRQATQDERRLPWMPLRAEFEAERHLGGMVSRLWQGQEQQQLYFFEQGERIRELEERIRELERRS